MDTIVCGKAEKDTIKSLVKGVSDKKDIIDGSRIRKGDKVIAVASNGFHTNGYSLVRMLMEMHPEIKKENIDGENFIDLIMKPHTAYYTILKGILDAESITGMAHITGGGIEGNLKRVIPDGLCAKIDLGTIKLLPIFQYIRNLAQVDDEEMLSTFNCGVGFVMIVKEKSANRIINHISQFINCYEIGVIQENNNDRKIDFYNHLVW